LTLAGGVLALAAGLLALAAGLLALAAGLSAFASALATCFNAPGLALASVFLAGFADAGLTAALTTFAVLDDFTVLAGWAAFFTFFAATL